MKKLKFFIAFISRFLKRYSKILLFSIPALLIILLIGWRLQESFFKNTISEGIVGTYTQDDLPISVTHLISRSLVKIDNSGRAIPNLVTGWQVNSDATEYTFKLKDNLTWSNGEKIKASDINLSLPDTQINTPDEKTIEIKLSDSYSFLPELLIKPILKKDTLIGTGPYNITGVFKDRRNDTFINKIKLNDTGSKLPELTLLFYSGEDTAKEALKLGKIQSLEGISDPSDINNLPFAVLSKPNYGRLVTIFYNIKDSVLSDKNFRLGLSFAAPEVTGEQIANDSFPPSFWVYNSQVRDFLNNPTEAKAFLDKVANGRGSTITLTTVGSLENVGNQVISAWNKNDIKAQLRVESGIPQNFQALLITQDIPLDPDQYALWHSTQTLTNISKLSSPRIDKDLEDGRKSTSDSARKLSYQDFQKVLLDEAPATFLYFPKFNVVYQKKIFDDLLPVLRIQFPNINF